ncbi:hypothetical protein ACVS9P_01380 [Caproicibacterium sp. NSD3]
MRKKFFQIFILTLIFIFSVGTMQIPSFAVETQQPGAGYQNSAIGTAQAGNGAETVTQNNNTGAAVNGHTDLDHDGYDDNTGAYIGPPNYTDQDHDGYDDKTGTYIGTLTSSNASSKTTSSSTSKAASSSSSSSKVTSSSSTASQTASGSSEVSSSVSSGFFSGTIVTTLPTIMLVGIILVAVGIIGIIVFIILHHRAKIRYSRSPRGKGRNKDYEDEDDYYDDEEEDYDDSDYADKNFYDNDADADESTHTIPLRHSSAAPHTSSPQQTPYKDIQSYSNDVGHQEDCEGYTPSHHLDAAARAASPKKPQNNDNFDWDQFLNSNRNK